MEWKYWRKILGGICMILFSIVLLLESLVFFEWWSGEIALLAGVISLVGFVKVYWNIPSEEEEAKRKKRREARRNKFFHKKRLRTLPMPFLRKNPKIWIDRTG